MIETLLQDVRFTSRGDIAGACVLRNSLWRGQERSTMRATQRSKSEIPDRATPRLATTDLSSVFCGGLEKLRLCSSERRE